MRRILGPLLLAGCATVPVSTAPAPVLPEAARTAVWPHRATSAPVVSEVAPPELPDCPPGTQVRVKPNSARCVDESGRSHGPALSWDPGGTVRTRSVFVAGRSEGLFRAWDGKGRLRGEESRVAGEVHGRARRWDEAGELVTDATWERGELTTCHQGPCRLDPCDPDLLRVWLDLDMERKLVTCAEINLGDVEAARVHLRFRVRADGLLHDLQVEPVNWHEPAASRCLEDVLKDHRVNWVSGQRACAGHWSVRFPTRRTRRPQRL